VLIGWIQARDVAEWVAEIPPGIAAHSEAIEHARRARIAVASRPPNGTQTNPTVAVPKTLDAHLEKLRQVPDYIAMLTQGFTVAVADLAELYALQPNVSIDQAAQRVATIDPDDLAALASLTLPISSPAPISVHFDESEQTWAFSSPDPNLRILGRFNAELEPAGYGFGFSIGVVPSFMQVTCFRNRYFLRDGYHRAYGLLANGVRFIPVMMRDCRSDSEFALPAGMLTQVIVLGERAPRLVDFFDDDVSATFGLSVADKVVTIQGYEDFGPRDS